MRQLAIALAVVLVSGSGAAAQEKPPSEAELYRPQGRETQKHFRAALVPYNRGDYAAALPELDKVIERQPRFARAIAYRAWAHDGLGDYGRAMQDHDRVLRLTPGDPKALANSCWARAAANVELDFALRLCDRALGAEESLSTLDYRGFVHFRRDSCAEALRDYDRALRIDSYASGQFMRGVCLNRLGRAEEGAAAIRAALKRDPKVQANYELRGVTP